MIKGTACLKGQMSPVVDPEIRLEGSPFTVVPLWKPREDRNGRPVSTVAARCGSELQWPRCQSRPLSTVHCVTKE